MQTHRNQKPPTLPVVNRQTKTMVKIRIKRTKRWVGNLVTFSCAFKHQLSDFNEDFMNLFNSWVKNFFSSSTLVTKNLKPSINVMPLKCFLNFFLSLSLPLLNAFLLCNLLNIQGFRNHCSQVVCVWWKVELCDVT